MLGQQQKHVRQERKESKNKMIQLREPKEDTTPAKRQPATDPSSKHDQQPRFMKPGTRVQRHHLQEGMRRMNAAAARTSKSKGFPDTRKGVERGYPRRPQGRNGDAHERHRAGAEQVSRDFSRTPIALPHVDPAMKPQSAARPRPHSPSTSTSAHE